MKHSMNDMLVIKHVSNIEKRAKEFYKEEKKSRLTNTPPQRATAIVISPANTLQNLSALCYTETDIRQRSLHPPVT